LNINTKIVVAVALFVAIANVAMSQSRYPKVNLAVGYQVDPVWPQKPPEIKWRYVTGVSVDAQDRVWILNAVAPQVQVYSTDGKLLEAWGSPTFKNPHYLCGLITKATSGWPTTALTSLRSSHPKASCCSRSEHSEPPGAMRPT